MRIPYAGNCLTSVELEPEANFSRDSVRHSGSVVCFGIIKELGLEIWSSSCRNPLDHLSRQNHLLSGSQEPERGLVRAMSRHSWT